MNALPPGQIVRRLLGPAFKPVGELYRRIFVDMAKVADWMAERLPPNARVLDIGGGDGYVVELLLRRRPDIHVTMTDVAEKIGAFIQPAHRDRVTLLPATDAASLHGPFDAITLADVVHHVPAPMQSEFLAMVGAVANRCGAKTVLIKDIRPGGLRALLALWGDMYITGDKSVCQLHDAALNLGGMQKAESAMPDFPNYCLSFRPLSSH
jgi:2-polyprenyl-6-hydroxyphenyl methylase/3-demethylubiquinone-9 3-methyltransferase